jgi:L-threonylcarbamoyladenylate synthase
MKNIVINLDKISDDEINLISSELKKGKVIAYPTDTIYGLGCDATNQKSINKIYKIKKRPKNKPLIILINGFPMLKKYFIIDSDKLCLLKQIWPGPFTAILNARNNLPDNLKSIDKSIGVRFPKNNFLIQLINKINRPLVSTSLNLSNRPNLKNLNQIDEYFPKGCLPDILIDAGKLKSSKPSTIIDVRDMLNIKILRD